jgi:hypothetical protein
MKTKLDCTLRLSLRNAGYSEKTVAKILRLYTLPEKKQIDAI